MSNDELLKDIIGTPIAAVAIYLLLSYGIKGSITPALTLSFTTLLLVGGAFIGGAAFVKIIKAIYNRKK